MCSASRRKPAVSVLDLDSFVRVATRRPATSSRGSATRNRCFSLYLRCQRDLAIATSERTTQQAGRLLGDPFAISLEWWVEEDLNLRPYAYQAYALTT